MIGCIIVGSLATVGILRFLHFRHHARWAYGCGGWRAHHHAGYGWGTRDGGEPWEPGFGPGPGAGFGRHRFGRGGVGRGRGAELAVRMLADRLQASPAQERALHDAFEELTAQAEPLKAEVAKTREELAGALRKPAFDEVLLGELFARHDRALEALRRAFVGALAKAHDALEPDQRERLARLVERGGPFASSGFGW